VENNNKKVAKNKKIRVDGKMLEILHFKKKVYRDRYGSEVKSINDVLSIDYGIKLIKQRRKK
jgi:hypothetical protein